MDQAQNWTWQAKRKHGLIVGNANYGPNSYKASSNNDDSWEEQAFAEDSSGPLGGCIWPPRSYSCSFCRREFRSAQALGGHMNVHRRDRARLKQSPPDLHDHNNQMINSLNCPSSSTISQIPKFPSQVCALTVYDHNPNPNSDQFLNPNQRNLVIAPPPPPPPPQQQSCHNSFLLLEENNHKNSNMKWSNNHSSWSNLASTTSNTTNYPYSSCSHKDLQGNNQKFQSITVDQSDVGSCGAKRDYHHRHHVKTTDLSVSLNLVVCRSCPTTTNLSGSCGKEDDHRQALVVSPCKRRKTTTNTDDDDDEEELFSVDSIDQVSPCSIHELDLELRLGIGLHK